MDACAQIPFAEAPGNDLGTEQTAGRRGTADDLMPKLYGLQTLEGPMVYVGCTDMPLQQRLKHHWNTVDSNRKPNSPIVKWLSSVRHPSDVLIVSLATLQPTAHVSFGNSLEKLRWKFEGLAIAHIAEVTLRGFGLINCNINHNPFRHKKTGAVDVAAVTRHMESMRWTHSWQAAEDVGVMQPQESTT